MGLAGLVIDDSSDHSAVDLDSAPTVFEGLTETMSFEETGLNAEDLVEPFCWRVLIFPRQPKKMTKGGIALPDQVQSAQMQLNYIGQIVRLGSMAGKNERYLNPEWAFWEKYQAHDSAVREPQKYCWDYKPGEWVLFGRYTGQVITYKNWQFIQVNDDDITGRVKNPEDFKVYV